MGADLSHTPLISIEEIQKAKLAIKGVAKKTPLDLNLHLSELYGAKVFLKREDLQIVRSYKVRGAFNKINDLDNVKNNIQVVCASAGNHAQGVAYACQALRIKGRIYMPVTTPNQKISKVRSFGKNYVEIILSGDDFDDAFKLAQQDAHNTKAHFIHPFDDNKVIAGQATVGLEILEELEDFIDYLFVPIGGGGLIAGLISVFKQLSPKTKLIGVEPNGAPSMKKSMENGYLTMLDQIDTFIDGAAVKCPGKIPYEICRDANPEIMLIPEGLVCATILDLYNEEAIVAEPAGALSIAALSRFKDQIKGKTVVCILSGGNNDIMRTEEIKERALLHKGLKQYFIIRFPQRAGALREFLNDVLGPNDDISFFQYLKKNNRSTGPAVVGLELKHQDDLQELIHRMDKLNVDYTAINDQPTLFEVLI